MTAPPVCPECGGSFFTDHPAGLAVQHEPTCSLLAHEDGRKVADRQLAIPLGAGPAWRRPATATECVLVAAAVGTTVPSMATTTLWELSGSIIRRVVTWTDGPNDRRWPDVDSW